MGPGALLSLLLLWPGHWMRAVSGEDSWCVSVPVDSSNVALGLPKVFGGCFDHVLIAMLEVSQSRGSPGSVTVLHSSQ